MRCFGHLAEQWGRSRPILGPKFSHKSAPFARRSLAREYAVPYSERFVRSIKDECLERMIFVGQASLRRAIGEYMAHYHEERNHQGLNNTLIRAESRDAANDAFIHRRQRLGGMLNYYYRAAA